MLTIILSAAAALLAFLAVCVAAASHHRLLLSERKREDLETRMRVVGDALQPCRHHWRCAGARPVDGAEMTSIIMRCDRCGHPMFSALYGRWTRSDIQESFDTAALEAMVGGGRPE